MPENEHIIHDLEIFIQGPKQTKATTQSYKSKITKKLDELDLDDLEQAWMTSGDDFYDYYPSYRDDNGYDDQTLNLILSPFLLEAQKYANNENYTESDKIFQATIEALRDKIKEIKNEHLDLEDWLFKEINETLNLYCKVLRTTDESSIKQAGLKYICMLFEHRQFDQNQKELGACLKEIVIRDIEAKICLRRLSCTINKLCLLPAESSLLAYLYLLASNEKEFEKVSTDNLTSNPQLALELLKFYKSRNRKPDILKLANQVFDHIHKKADLFDWHSFENLEIEILRFLKTVFDSKTEYRQIIDNLETLFLKSNKIDDYQELALTYDTCEEKERLLERMRGEFTKQHEIEIMFKVFKLEDKKRDILELTNKYKDENCFADMIMTISDIFPQESFSNYKIKIIHLLKDGNVKYYPQVANHLIQMRNIGLTDDFKRFVNWIATSYKRRYRLIEELQKNKLV